MRFEWRENIYTTSKLVFIDDGRLFHYSRETLEELSDMRLKTTKAVGGMASASKPHAWYFEETDGEINKLVKDVWVGAPGSQWSRCRN